MLNIEEIKSRLDTLTARKVELNDEAAGIDRSVRDIAMDLHRENEMLRRHSDQLFQQLQLLCNTIQTFNDGEGTVRSLHEVLGPTHGILDNIENETKFFYREDKKQFPLVEGNAAFPVGKEKESSISGRLPQGKMVGLDKPLSQLLTKAETTPLNGSHSA